MPLKGQFALVTGGSRGIGSQGHLGRYPAGREAPEFFEAPLKIALEQ